MNEDPRQIECGVHGLQDETFVCQHIVGSLRTQQAVGFHWPVSSPQRRPDAWCSDCEKRRIAGGGDWTEAVLASVGLKVLCGRCYDTAKSIWQATRDAGRKAF